MKIDGLFFLTLLIAYDDLCRDYVLLRSDEEVETVFYRKIVEAFFSFQGLPGQNNLVTSIVGGYPILKKVLNDSEMFLGLEVENRQLKGE